MASYRLRTEIPAKQIGAQINGGDAHVIVFSKPMAGDIELARVAKGRAKIVLDVCDPHDYGEMAQLADTIVVSSEALLERFPGATVIPDPIEGDGGEPHAHLGTLGWVGMHTGLPALQEWMKQVPQVPVMICTTPGKMEGAIPWSEAAQKFVYANAGVMLVPAANQYKSNNRVSQAIHEGCFVIASRIPAYAEFQRYVWVGEYPTGARWALRRSDLNDLVLEGQKYVREQYSAERIGSLWASVCT